MDVYGTAAAALDRLVTRRLQPPPEFVGAARRALGALDAALRERGGRRGGAGPGLRVLKTVKVSGLGTLRDPSGTWPMDGATPGPASGCC